MYCSKRCRVDARHDILRTGSKIKIIEDSCIIQVVCHPGLDPGSFDGIVLKYYSKRCPQRWPLGSGMPRTRSGGPAWHTTRVWQDYHILRTLQHLSSMPTVHLLPIAIDSFGIRQYQPELLHFLSPTPKKYRLIIEKTIQPSHTDPGSRLPTHDSRLPHYSHFSTLERIT